MARVRSNLLTWISVFLLSLGLMAPAAATPCAAGPGADCSMASCDLCLPGALPETAGCAAASSGAPASMAPGIGRTLGAAEASFHVLAARLDGRDTRPDAPPPR